MRATRSVSTSSVELITPSRSEVPRELATSSCIDGESGIVTTEDGGKHTHQALIREEAGLTMAEEPVRQK